MPYIVYHMREKIMKDIGLVLSGGMVKGAYQIGALKAISEYIQPKILNVLVAHL